MHSETWGCLSLNCLLTDESQNNSFWQPFQLNVGKLFSLRKNIWNIVISKWISAVIYSQLESDMDAGWSQVGSGIHCSSEEQEPALAFQQIILKSQNCY